MWRGITPALRCRWGGGPLFDTRTPITRQNKACIKLSLFSRYIYRLNPESRPRVTKRAKSGTCPDLHNPNRKPHGLRTHVHTYTHTQTHTRKHGRTEPGKLDAAAGLLRWTGARSRETRNRGTRNTGAGEGARSRDGRTPSPFSIAAENFADNTNK